VTSICVLITGLLVAPGNPAARRSTVPMFESHTQSIPVYATPRRQGSVLFVEDPGVSVFGPLTKPDPQWKAVLDQLLGSGNYGWCACTTGMEQSGPPLDTLSQYELVIWNTYDYWWQDTAALTEEDQNNIGAYLEAGGRLWLIGQDIVWSGVPVSWLTDYFHVTSIEQDYDTLADSICIEGQAMLDGLLCTTTADFQNNVFYPDELIPDAQAYGVVRDTSTMKTVGILYYGSDWISSFWSVDGRITNPGEQWVAMVDSMLSRFGISTAVEETTPDYISHGLEVVPNPMVYSAEIRMSLSQSTTLSISIYDACGRHVRTVCTQKTAQGLTTFIWDGRDEQGFCVRSGVYYVVVHTSAGWLTERVVVIQ
jgi:hypothetical protein